MKLKYIDAVDAFSYGGFICIETMKYIAPRWLAEMDTSNDIYSSEKDYASIEHDLIHYIKVPTIRLTGIAARAGIRINISREELLDAGMIKTDYWDVFYPNVHGVIQRCSDVEWEIVNSITDISRKRKLYYEFCKAKEIVTKKIITDWLSDLGVDIE